MHQNTDLLNGISYRFVNEALSGKVPDDVENTRKLTRDGEIILLILDQKIRLCRKK